MLVDPPPLNRQDLALVIGSGLAGTVTARSTQGPGASRVTTPARLPADHVTGGVAQVRRHVTAGERHGRACDAANCAVRGIGGSQSEGSCATVGLGRVPMFTESMLPK